MCDVIKLSLKTHCEAKVPALTATILLVWETVIIVKFYLKYFGLLDICMVK